jgi:hypothetical protein
LIDLIDKVEYWYYSEKRGIRVRYHKHVYFYLLRYISGSTEDHDEEVNEARWVNLDVGREMLTFKNEKNLVAKAEEMIKSLR